MKKMTNVKSLLLTCCAVGVLAAANQSWAADATITNCAQVSAQGEADTDSTPQQQNQRGRIAGSLHRNAYRIGR